MANIELCHECGTVVYPVPWKTVKNLAKLVPTAAENKKWYACLNKNCSVAYCSSDAAISINDLQVPLWYKDSGKDVPICYCSKITRDEIKKAVAKGAFTIKDVQEITGKNITGKCLTENPLGKCCKNVFMRTIKEAQESIKLEKKEPKINKKLKILFLCTGNSCRSQMAEGWAKYLKSDCVEPYSAGVEVHGLNQYAVKVMAEAGVDISKHKSKHLNELKDIQFDWVITVCDSANESCPVFPGDVKRFHVSFDDPPKLAKNAKSEEEAISYYRRVRDEIRAFIEKLPQNLYAIK